MNSVEKSISNLALKRYNNQKERCLKYSKDTILGDYIDIITTSYNNGFKCFYCNKTLKFSQPRPNLDVASIDHKTPLVCGGTSNKDNLCVCCFECNIIKGTMSAETFILILKELTLETKQKMFKEAFRAKFANKLYRQSEEKTEETK